MAKVRLLFFTVFQAHTRCTYRGLAFGPIPQKILVAQAIAATWDFISMFAVWRPPPACEGAKEQLLTVDEASVRSDDADGDYMAALVPLAPKATSPWEHATSQLRTLSPGSHAGRAPSLQRHRDRAEPLQRLSLPEVPRNIHLAFFAKHWNWISNATASKGVELERRQKDLTCSSSKCSVTANMNRAMQSAKILR